MGLAVLYAASLAEQHAGKEEIIQAVEDLKSRLTSSLIIDSTHMIQRHYTPILPVLQDFFCGRPPMAAPYFRINSRPKALAILPGWPGTTCGRCSETRTILTGVFCSSHTRVWMNRA